MTARFVALSILASLATSISSFADIQPGNCAHAASYSESKRGNSIAAGCCSGIGVRLRPEPSSNFRGAVAAKTERTVDHFLFGRECSVAAWPDESRIQKRRPRQSVAGERL